MKILSTKRLHDMKMQAFFVCAPRSCPQHLLNNVFLNCSIYAGRVERKRDVTLADEFGTGR